MADDRPPSDLPDAAATANTSGKRRRIDWSIVFFLVLCLVSGLASWWLHGREAVASEARDAAWTVAGVVPQLTLGILIAAFAQVVVPRDKVGRLLGEQSGLRGLVLATVYGVVMPGGPSPRSRWSTRWPGLAPTWVRSSPSWSPGRRSASAGC